MSVAQQLYEGVEIEGLGATALVTYIRTDSVRVSEEAEQEARTYIKDKFGADYLPKAPRSSKTATKPRMPTKRSGRRILICHRSRSKPRSPMTSSDSTS